MDWKNIVLGRKIYPGNQVSYWGVLNSTMRHSHGMLGANRLSGLVARDLSGFMFTEEVSHETDRITAGDPDDAI